MVFNIHADLDAFYASLEQRDFLEYRGKPIAVITGTRGPVASASYEAKRFGIKSGMPVYQAIELCPNLILIKGRHNLYQQESQNFLEICRKYGTAFPYGLDEAWIDLPSAVTTLNETEKMGWRIKQDVKDGIGITASVGISTDNRLLAKMASDLEKPDGLTVVTLEDMERKLYHLPVRDLFMVGKSTEKTLIERLEVLTIGDLAKLPLEMLILCFKHYRGRMLYNYSHGIVDPPIPLYAYQEEARKSISHMQTLEKDRRDLPFLEAMLFILSQYVWRDLRAEDFYFTRMHTIVRFEDFTETEKLSRFQFPSDSRTTIFQAAKNSLNYYLHLIPKNVRALAIKASGLVRGEIVRKMPEQLEMILK